jgi:hypothetical protein
MSAARNQIGISSIGVQSIMPTTGTLQWAAKRKPGDDRRNAQNVQVNSNQEPPSPHSPGTGSLVDKSV